MRSFFNPKQNDYEISSQEDLTIPDQALTVEDIINNFSRGGMSIPPVEKGNDEDIDSDDFDFDDIVDAQESLIGSLDNIQSRKKKVSGESLKADGFKGKDEAERSESEDEPGKESALS